MKCYLAEAEIIDFHFSIKKFYKKLKKKELIIKQIKHSSFFKDINKDNMDFFFKKIKSIIFKASIRSFNFKLGDFPYDIIKISKVFFSLTQLTLFLNINNLDETKYKQLILDDYSTINIYDTIFNVDSIKILIGLNIFPFLFHFIEQLKKNINPKNKKKEYKQQKSEEEDDQTSIEKRLSQSILHKKNESSKINNIHLTNPDRRFLRKNESVIKINKYNFRRKITAIQDFVKIQKDNPENKMMEKYRFQNIIFMKGNLKNLDLGIMNSTSAYKTDCIKIKLPICIIRIEKNKLILLLKKLEIENCIEDPKTEMEKKIIGKILEIPQIEIIFEVKWHTDFSNLTLIKFFQIITSPEQIFLKYFEKCLLLQKYHLNMLSNIPKSLDENKKIKSNPTMYLKLDLINYIINLPQLKTDYLMRNKLVIIKEEKKQKKIEIKKDNYNYLEFFESYMNYQLNSAKNIFNKCTHVSIKVFLSSLKLFFFQNEEFKDKVLPLDCTIKGFQAVIDEMKLSAHISKVDFTLKNFYRMQTQDKKLLKWDVTKYKGAINFIYASFYDEKYILEIKPDQLFEKRKEIFDKSLNNPNIFNAFFNIQNRNVFDFEYNDYIINSLFYPPVFGEDDFEFNNNKNEFFQSKDLEFHYNKIFFKIDFVKFEKDKTLIIDEILINEDVNKFLGLDFTKEIKVDQNFSIIGFKFIFSNLIKIVIVEMIEKISNFSKSFQKKKKKKK